MTEKTIADVLEFAPRAEELATRLVAAGPKAAHVSASETHEIADFVHMAILALRRQSPEASAPVAEQAALSAQSATKDDKAALGLPECGKPLCAPGEHHPLCRHGWAEKKAASAPVAGEARMPTGYRVKVVDGHGYRITPPTGGDWVAHSDTPAGDLIAALLAAPQARPSDDELWDQTLAERDEYHDMADKLADAIADHLLVEIGEHSSSNCPWMRALDAIQNAAPQASEAARDDVIEQIAALIGGHTWGDASEEVSRLIARHIRKLKSQGAALSAQPADKPATPRAAPAPMPRQQCVCRLAETGNAHTDGGAVYE